MNDEDYNYDTNAVEAAKRQTERETDDHIAQLSAHWQVEHAQRASQIEQDLLAAHIRPSSSEKLILGLASHDAALAEILARSETQLAYRVLAAVDDFRVAHLVAKTLRQVTVCRGAAETRVSDMLMAAGIIRGQHKLVESVPRLRRVA